MVKAVAQPTKQAFLYVFNRETGEPHLAHRRAAAWKRATVPGEWYSPTQPFPTKPAAVRSAGIPARGPHRLHAGTARRGRDRSLSKYKIGPIFTPPVVSKVDGPLATLAMATGGGGTNWPGGSLDPETSILYVSSSKVVSSLGLVPPRDPVEDRPRLRAGQRRHGRADDRRRRGPAPPAARALAVGLTVRGLPLVKPPYGQISAIDMKKGEILWQVPHGETPDNVRNHPALKGLTIPRTGRPGTVGTLVTKTLLVAGEAGFGPTPSGARGAMLRAYDKAHGQGSGRRVHAGAADRVADDLYAERRQVHRGGRVGRGLQRRAARVPASRLDNME